MNKAQKIKFGVLIAAVSYGTQIALLRPGEGAGVVLLLGTISAVVTIGFIYLCVWIAKP